MLYTILIAWMSITNNKYMGNDPNSFGDKLNASCGWWFRIHNILFWNTTTVISFQILHDVLCSGYPYHIVTYYLLYWLSCPLYISFANDSIGFNVKWFDFEFQKKKKKFRSRCLCLLILLSKFVWICTINDATKQQNKIESNMTESLSGTKKK